jgi:hypothetical protein
MNEANVSQLPDEDMQGVLNALVRAGRRAREVARQTGTAVVIVRDGKLIEEREERSEPSTPGHSAD